MKLYANNFSQPSLAVIQFLKENNIDFELVHLDLGKLEHKKPEFLKLNPQGQVPTLEDDDGFALSESAAILIYLHEKFKTKDHWYPADIKKRAKVNQWLNWNHTHTRKASVGIVFHSIWAPLIFKKPIEEFKSVIDEGKKVLKESLDVLEVTLQQSKFLIGDEISIADLIIAHELFSIAVYKLYDWTSSHPNVSKWFDTIKNFGKFSEVTKHVEEFAKKRLQ